MVRYAPEGDPASNGIGLALTPGTPIRSVSKGKVVHNDQLRGFGQVVVVFHGEDYYSLYAFLSDAPVPVGREVNQENRSASADSIQGRRNRIVFRIAFWQKAINPLKWLQPG